MSHFDDAAAAWDDNPNRVALMRTVGQAVMEHVRPGAGLDVLDYGCGTGLLGLYLLEHVRSVTGADNSPGMLEVLDRKIADSRLANVRTLRLDLERDAVPDERYDLITTGMALHHMADVDAALRGFHKLLRPGGRVCIVDLDSEDGRFHGRHAATSVHHHGFDRGQLKAHLERVGFVEPADATVVTFTRPVEGGGEAEFSIFLVTARRP